MTKNAKKLLVIFIVLLILYVIELSYIHSKNTIMKVDGIDITKAQFDKTFAQNGNIGGFLAIGIDVKRDKKSLLYKMIKNKTVEDLIKQTLIDEEIEKKHIKVSNKELNKEIVDTIKKSGSRENFDALLKINQISMAQFKKDLREELKKQKLAESISKIVISDAEARKYYKENLNKFKHNDTARVSHIFVAANYKRIEQEIKSDPNNKSLSDSEIKAKVEQEKSIRLEKIEKLLSILKNNPSLFAKIAKENSEDRASAINGGDLGVITKQQMSPYVEKIVFSIKLNKMSDIIKTSNGYHIILVSDRTKGGEPSFEKEKDDVIFTLEKQKQNKILDDLATSMEKQAKIEYLKPEYKPSSLEKDSQKPEQKKK